MSRPPGGIIRFHHPNRTGKQQVPADDIDRIIGQRFAKRVLALRVGLRLSRRAVFLQTGIKWSRMRDLEQARHSPRLDEILKLARVYDVDYRELIRESVTGRLVTLVESRIERGTPDCLCARLGKDGRHALGRVVGKLAKYMPRRKKGRD